MKDTPLEKVFFSYNHTLYHTGELKKIIPFYIRALPPETRGLLTRGSSGCAIATAMMMRIRRSMIHTHLRKKGTAHSTRSDFSSRVGYAIVDDFIDRGHTVLELLECASACLIKVTHIIVHHVVDGWGSGLYPELYHLLKERKIRLIELTEQFHLPT